MSVSERSASRGREGFQSTGRGGIGNIRQASLSRDARPESGPDDFSVTRGREAITNPKQIFSTGRGGVGNLRSPSRDVHKNPASDSVEEDVIREYKASQEGAPVSTGRGGLGNINRSRSRDPSTGPRSSFHSTGRGGAGNLVADEGSVTERIDEDDLIKHHATHEGYHSTGRGGAANITTIVEPPVEHHSHAKNEYESTGRGGAGNLVKEV
ncbi:hypothetical protein BYT27DRAFT_7185238 [Phlegmacium glaucopus]|nr:hypothetical protein BYT27DRAFT_7185238 [Phlegmacium glaucopus]